MVTLFEFGKWKNIENVSALKEQLIDIWRNRKRSMPKPELTEEELDKRYQPFLRIDGAQVRARNYVGFIKNGETTIEIYPKIFKQAEPTIVAKRQMLRHIFFWLGYCRKWRFPFNQANLEAVDIESFPELIINLIAYQFLETLQEQPLNQYHEVEEAMQNPRGRINFKRYVAKSLARGNNHLIECDHEPFLFDNKVNRIIKYCARLLMEQTEYSENERLLQEVIFILDEVDDRPFTAQDTAKITFNSFFDAYAKVIDSCSLILKNQLYSNNSYDLSQWCLLFPMEYIFEDFLAGFLKKWFSGKWKVDYQKSDKYLAKNELGRKVFQMQHDIFLTKRDRQRSIIIDAKYKVRDPDFKDKLKKGVAQNDLYQMVGYGFRRGCTDIILIYPNASEELQAPDKFEIESGFDSTVKIKVTVVEIPFWSMTNFTTIEENLKMALEKLLAGY